MRCSTALAVTLAAFRMGPMINLIASGLNSIFTSATLLSQTGTTKTAAGWGIVALCIGLGLLVICRPNGRNVVEKKWATKKKK